MATQPCNIAFSTPPKDIPLHQILIPTMHSTLCLHFMSLFFDFHDSKISGGALYYYHGYSLSCSLKYKGRECSKCERQGHDLFYVDNTAQVRGELQGTLGEEYRADWVGILVLNYSKTGGR